jgi:twitching motility two-component system response regulator PilH
MNKFGFGSLLGRDKSGKERRKKPRMPHFGSSILIVDDSSTVVFALKKLLEQDGYSVLTANNGEQALVTAETHKPDLILMDVIMPGMNGFQATRRIRKIVHLEATPIIIISASEQKTEEFWLRKLGANDFLPKPITRGQLFPTIEKYLFSQVA